MDKPTHVLLVAALTIVIVAGIVYIADKKPRLDCWNFFGLTRGCAATITQ